MTCCLFWNKAYEPAIFIHCLLPKAAPTAKLSSLAYKAWYIYSLAHYRKYLPTLGVKGTWPDCKLKIVSTAVKLNNLLSPTKCYFIFLHSSLLSAIMSCFSCLHALPSWLWGEFYCSTDLTETRIIGSVSQLDMCVFFPAHNSVLQQPRPVPHTEL